MAKIWEILGWSEHEKRLAEFGAKALGAKMKRLFNKERETAPAMPLSIDDLRAIMANLGQDLSNLSDEEVREMLGKQEALQNEAEDALLNDHCKKCPHCKIEDERFLQHENGITIKCCFCHNSFKRINGVWVHWEAAFFEYSNINIVGKSVSKYSRMIGPEDKQIAVDVYDVLKAFNVSCPARQHAIKKLLAPGIRGSKTEKQDLQEAIASINRAIELLGK